MKKSNRRKDSKGVKQIKAIIENKEKSTKKEEEKKKGNLHKDVPASVKFEVYDDKVEA